ncbi:transketolase family protein [Paenibacillus cremeus]|uniref:Transketolase n=1 Tax=Paenibacillus cremeus TaxID=2163881 RepID=A0A559K502_9BACL|nr:transketolase C-terminal domain-containing protein [Paenibacillus cremeus]TVY07221.1 transketolase [Paenibacillus cremeus]
MRDTFVKTLIEIAKKDKKVHLITGDLGFGVLKPFWEEFPEQFTNAGIAEQNMTGLAAGMALEGKIVYTYSIGNFPTLRCLEQIRNDCAYHNANVKVVCVGGGFVYGSLGMSHHATEDLSIMRALPGVTVLAPGDLVEAEYATKAIYENNGTCYLRLGRGGEKRIHEKLNEFKIGEAIKVRDGSKVAILSTGAIFDEVIEASELLKRVGITPSLYTFPTVKPIDKKAIEVCAEKYELIVTIEEHNIIGGFGSAISEVLGELRVPKARLLKIGLEDKYSSVVGSQKYLRDVYGISAIKIAKRIAEILEGF